MRRIISILKNISKIINKIIISLCLMVAYVIICVYCIFKKKNNRLWLEYDNKSNELDQTKHPW